MRGMEKIKKDVGFEASLGEGNDVLPGEIFTLYSTIVYQDSMVFIAPNKERYSLDFTTLSEASFSPYIFEENLWFSCRSFGKRYCFAASPKSWNSVSGKRLIERVSHYVQIQNLKDLALYTHDGPTTVLLHITLH